MKLFLSGVGVCCLVVAGFRIFQLQEPSPTIPASGETAEAAHDAADNWQPPAQGYGVFPSPDSGMREPAVDTAAARKPVELELLPRPHEWREQPVKFIVVREEMQKPEFNPTWLRWAPNAAEQEQFLRSVTEVRFINDSSARAFVRDEAHMERGTAGVSDAIANNPATAGFPWLQDKACRLGDDEAKRISGRARQMRMKRSLFDRQTLPDADHVRLMMQMGQGEDGRQRLDMITVLDKFYGPEAGIALARLAVFDTDPEARAKAIECLQLRPSTQWRPTILSGFRHVWPLAAVHASQALVALVDRNALPDLIPLLDKPDPATAFSDGPNSSAYGVRELVRLNHNHNCVVCHATSNIRLEMGPLRTGVGSRIASEFTSLDFFTPVPGKELPPSLSVEYYSPPGVDALAIRLDVTYLRQDFSVTLPCEKKSADKWPERQRFDFITRIRPATAAEVRAAQLGKRSYPQREAVLHVLRTLTGKDGGESAAEWEQILLGMLRDD